ncbi:ferredoxin [Mycobacterium frederiksbergense]|uniref:Ferredoxin n=1 Tax=Mycolicibacterium frederiksbergense TaxID=117567 RepID=A0ABT6KXL2_9MYCO|nr:ferredoxin [Mycolicibacterium frederiksbergense]MDH6195435.1 ferredoxin [Mycolicibacterium frederiksbergense]
MRVQVDDDRCRGHGVCVAVCPDVFTLTDGGYAAPLMSDVPAELAPAVQEAIAGCPENAITLG